MVTRTPGVMRPGPRHADNQVGPIDPRSKPASAAAALTAHRPPSADGRAVEQFSCQNEMTRKLLSPSSAENNEG